MIWERPWSIILRAWPGGGIHEITGVACTGLAQDSAWKHSATERGGASGTLPHSGMLMEIYGCWGPGIQCLCRCSHWWITHASVDSLTREWTWFNPGVHKAKNKWPRCEKCDGGLGGGSGRELTGMRGRWGWGREHDQSVSHMCTKLPKKKLIKKNKKQQSSRSLGMNLSPHTTRTETECHVWPWVGMCNSN